MFSVVHPHNWISRNTSFDCQELQGVRFVLSKNKIYFFTASIFVYFQFWESRWVWVYQPYSLLFIIIWMIKVLKLNQNNDFQSFRPPLGIYNFHFDHCLDNSISCFENYFRTPQNFKFLTKNEKHFVREVFDQRPGSVRNNSISYMDNSVSCFDNLF